MVFYTGVPITSITLNQNALTLTVGDTATLTTAIEPTNATNKNVTWFSENDNVATVINGTVTAIAVGSTIITVTTQDVGKTAECAITVEPISVTGVTLNQNTLTLIVGVKATLTASIAPSNAANKNVTWSSGNTSVATVTDGAVIAVAVGSTTITVTTQDGEKTTECAVTVEPLIINMIQIPGGSFEMGSTSEYPVHTVTLSGFYMGKYEVTQEQWTAVMGNNPSYFPDSPASGEVQSKRPVEQVSWYDALVFCNKLSMREGLSPAYRISGSTDPAKWGSVPTSNDDPKKTIWDAVVIIADSTGYRLPTEAQWEYAARGGNGSPGGFTYSGSNDVNEVAWYWDNSSSKTHEVGKKAPNGLGLYDMSGNVCEWCWDWFGSYTSGAQTDPGGADSGSERVSRGGGWGNSAEYARSTSRSRYAPLYNWYGHIGFRLVRP